METQRSALSQNLHFCKSKNVNSNSSEKLMLKHVHSLPGLVTVGAVPGTLKGGRLWVFTGAGWSPDGLAAEQEEERLADPFLAGSDQSLHIFWRFNHLGFVTGAHGSLGTARGLVCNTGMM